LTLQALTDSNVTIVSNGPLGNATVQYYICDNGTPVKCDTGTIFIHIDPCDKPVVDNIHDTIASCVSTTDSICLSSYVHLSNSYTWSITNMCAPQNGTIANNATCFTYTPNTGFYGNDTFCVVVCSNIGICDTAQIIMTNVDCIIQAVDEPCDLDTTIMNVPITLDVLANDILPWAADTTVSLLTLPVNGSAVVNHSNTVTYTPNTNYKGNEQFSYVVCAVTGSYIYCDTANICITVVDTTQPCYIPNAFSPNGDGTNDVYKIPCNERSPKATLRIFDRWGVEVWFSEGAYMNDWGGKNKQGTELPDGTYYIIYEYNDGTGKREAKFVVIQR
jgi:gliding motility-associated-like protein